MVLRVCVLFSHFRGFTITEKSFHNSKQNTKLQAQVAPAEGAVETRETVQHLPLTAGRAWGPVWPDLLPCLLTNAGNPDFLKNVEPPVFAV